MARIAVVVVLLLAALAAAQSCAPVYTQSAPMAAGAGVVVNTSCPVGTSQVMCSCVPMYASPVSGRPQYAVVPRITKTGVECSCDYVFPSATPAGTFLLKSCALCDLA